VEAPVYAIGGDVDPRCPPEQLPEWEQYTSGKCEVQVFPGGHFFIKDKEGDLLAWIHKTLTADA
jgi:surfactin synthase thioesterase subunit